METINLSDGPNPTFPGETPDPDPALEADARRAAIYCRYSTPAQGHQSEDRQRELAARLAERMGVEVGQVYTDAGKSGTTLHARDGLENLLADAKQGRFQLVFVESVDRLARDMVDLHDVFRNLVRNGIELYECSGGIVSDIGLLFGGLLGEDGRVRLLEMTYRGRRIAVESKKSVPHRPRYGFRPCPGASFGRVVHAERANVVRGVFADYLAGVPIAEIARDLTKAGKPTPGNCTQIDGGSWKENQPFSSWTADMVSSLLRSPVYKGALLDCVTKTIRHEKTHRVLRYVQRPHEEWLRVELDERLQIIDPNTWDSTCLLLHEREINKDRAFRRNEYLLNRLVFCGACGRTMRSFTQNNHRRWRCVEAAARSCAGVGRPRLAHVEREVLLAIKDVIAAPEFGTIYQKAYQLEYSAHALRLGQVVPDEMATVRARRQKLLDRIELLINFGDRTGFSRQRLGKQVEEMRGELAKLDRQIKASAARQRNMITVATVLPESFSAGLEAMLSQLPFKSESRESRRLVASLRDLIDGVTLMPVQGQETPDLDIDLHLGALVGRRSKVKGTHMRLFRRDGVTSRVQRSDVWTGRDPRGARG